MKVRIKFQKNGVMKFISHLDVMRYFQKAMRRADIPVSFSNGYSPHMIMSFANPLGVGMTSDGEYFDIELREEITMEEMKNRLNAVMVEGMKIAACTKLSDQAKNGMSIVAAADYISTIAGDAQVEAFDEKVQSFMDQQEIRIFKKTKRSEREVNIRPMIYEMKAQDNQHIFMKLATGSVENLKSELVCQALQEYLQLDSVTFTQHRVETYGNLGTMEDRKLVSLEQYDHES